MILATSADMRQLWHQMSLIERQIIYSSPGVSVSRHVSFAGSSQSVSCYFAGATGRSGERSALRGIWREPAAQRTQRALVHASEPHGRGAGAGPRRQCHLRPGADHGLPGAEFQRRWDSVAGFQTPLMRPSCSPIITLVFFISSQMFFLFLPLICCTFCCEFLPFYFSDYSFKHFVFISPFSLGFCTDPVLALLSGLHPVALEGEAIW